MYSLQLIEVSKIYCYAFKVYFHLPGKREKIEKEERPLDLGHNGKHLQCVGPK
jgi:hypothetical protein